MDTVPVLEGLVLLRLALCVAALCALHLGAALLHLDGKLFVHRLVVRQLFDGQLLTVDDRVRLSLKTWIGHTIGLHAH